ncbi:MAG: DNRLRE domain-containing protein [Chloroflexi bacterium]|nr:DNRLRE domain-containing protein [Chloroflexota bacterium]
MSSQAKAARVAAALVAILVLFSAVLPLDAAPLEKPRPTRSPSPTLAATPLAGSTTVTFPAVADALIDVNRSPNANFGALDYLELYQYDKSDRRHFLVRFDTGSLPPNAQIQSAQLQMHSFDADYDSGTQDALVHRVTRAWVEGSGKYFGVDGRNLGTTWYQAAPNVLWTNPGGDYDTTIIDRITLTANPNKWFSWNVTTSVKFWLSNGQNYGLLVRPVNGDWLNHKFYSRESSDASLRPRLVVTYSTSGARTPNPTKTAEPTRTATKTLAPTLTPTRANTATPAPSPTSSSTAGSPTIAGCPVFPADNVWNRDVSNDPVDANSAAYISRINQSATYLHADFGSPREYGIPFVVVPGSQAKVPITFTEYGDESDAGPYPVPANAPVEYGEDQHVLVLNSGECKLYEMYHAQKDPNGAGWLAGSGAVFDLRSNLLRPQYWTSADAAGLPILPGLTRYDEVAAGEIRHALRFTVARTQRAFVHPATHYASSTTDPSYPPMGLRVRLKSSYDVSRFSGQARVILNALKKYGMLVADNGSSWFITGATDSRWNDDDLNQLKTVPGSVFEVVQLGTIYR